MFYRLFFILGISSSIIFGINAWPEQPEQKRPLKCLHLSFHKGCIVEIDHVAKALGVDVTPWFIFDRPLEHFEGQNAGLYVYNITAERAQRVWEKHKDYFEQFDAIITSDTTPLSRIFLQNNNWKKPLIIWVCNRFDFFFSPSHTPIDFPDDAYYELIKDAATRDNVFIIPYTNYEWYHALKKGVDIGLRTIKPIGVVEDAARYKDPSWSVPAHVNKKNTVFVYPRLSKQELAFVTQNCNQHGIATYCGKYNGPADIADFKGMIHWGLQWSNLSLFENFHRGLVHFVPSKKMLQDIDRQGFPLMSTLGSVLRDNASELCEWYTSAHKDLIVYFDSWADLKHKIDTLDFDALSTNIKAFAKQHTQTMLEAWQEVFDQVAACLE